ncbi:MAG: DNA replication ATP-dependent helicase Dna2 [Saprospiraceae bacterium]|mgnify:CR=1 FL=1|jgi:DNA replication ATP-dependent helicase Dna2
MIKNEEVIFLEAKSRILKSSEYTAKKKTKALFNLLTTIIEEVTQDEKITFTTLFSRIAFMSNRFKFDPSLMYYLHTFRRDNERMKVPHESEHYVKLGSFLVDQIINKVWKKVVDTDEIPADIIKIFQGDKKEVVKFKPVIEAIIDSVDVENYKVNFYDETDATILRTAVFDQGDKNELFNESVELLGRSFSFPIHANFIDVEILEDGTHVPSAIVIEPDYLLDVTAVANCFKDYGTESMLRLIDKFKMMENSIPLMVGNVANLFLDEIISNPDVKFNDLLPGIFKLDPMGLAVFEDKDIRELVTIAKNHYLNLKKTVATELPAQGIKRNKVFLEPSFYSRDFGLQGRLDLFHYVKEKNQFDIVELKSGKPFRANVYGLSSTHYSQTLLYDLMIKSAFGYHRKPNNYILYSKLTDKSLKYAPPVKSQQYEAMKVRNDLIAIEFKMASSGKAAQELYSYIKSGNFPQAKGFVQKDIEGFQNVYSKLPDLDRAYFNEFSSFICREHRMAKTGEHGINKSNGLSALWLENLEEKEDRFAVLKQMVIKENKSRNDVPTIVLERTEETSRLANFREGDIAVLYPYSDNPKAVLKNQIFKCTILSINESEVEVKLRSKQYNDILFTSIESWNIEEDSLDSGFNTLYRSLWEFMGTKKEKKSLWLGERKPRGLTKSTYEPLDNLTDEQNILLDKMTNVQDYFLLWGPPGTGKTSVMLKSLVERLYTNSDESILLLAYTNRAVDEMCAAIESIAPEFYDNYIRIGSATSCGQAYRPRLINNLIADLTKREDIRSLLKGKRIYVSTVSSIVSKAALFKLIKFDRVIIDEASQILEPLLVGLLSRIEKAILIGDHKQLPAVVTQDEQKTKIVDASLHEIGITDMRMSLFERVYHQCKNNNWDHALGLLSFQGRMQKELMAFPNSKFYEGHLNVLPGIDRLVNKRNFKSESVVGKILVNQRFLYIPTHVDEAFNWKTNKYESKKVLKIVKDLEELYRENNMEIDDRAIGIITPYRAQIATIKSEFETVCPHLLDKITIDTVERYQGGARDIIILSLCTNRMSQLRSLVSLSKEGVDRKLNVAVTRAREQLIVIGNREILEGNETYQSLINSAFEWNV